MSSEFDLSPRLSKRRKTNRYGAQRTTLPESATQDEGNTVSVEQPNQSNSVTPKGRASVKNSKDGSNKRQSPASQDDSPPESEAEDMNEQDINVTPSKASKKINGISVHRRNLADGEGTLNGQNDNVEADIGQTEANGHNAAEDDTPKIRSSGRQRKKPNRFAETAAEIPVLKPTTKPALQLDSPEKSPERTIASPVIKGILTPSRRQKTPGPRKSVMFDQDEAAIGEQFGFKDIDTPARTVAKKSIEKRSPRKTALIAREALPEDSEAELELQNEEVTANHVHIEEPPIDVVIPEIIEHQTTTTAPVTEDDVHVRGIKSQILSRLTSASLPKIPPPHLESQYNQLHNLLQSTIVSSESNSLLLLGPRGAGKSTLLSLALRDLTSEYSSDFHTVHLNGFFQTDDRLALREIWRQLGREMQVDEVETEDVAGSYADTMVSLLSLLSHPDEMQVDDQIGTDDVEALASNAVQIAGGGQRTSKSIVFILDEFDLFTNHPRQTLLYNLFDIAQSRKAPIAVIGCSTRMDVIECLEKRVKSRFSHRWLLVPNCKTFLEWEGLVRQTLLADGPAKFSSIPQEEAVWTSAWNEHIQVRSHNLRRHPSGSPKLTMLIDDLSALKGDPVPSEEPLLHYKVPPRPLYSPLPNNRNSYAPIHIDTFATTAN